MPPSNWSSSTWTRSNANGKRSTVNWRRPRGSSRRAVSTWPSVWRLSVNATGPNRTHLRPLSDGPVFQLRPYDAFQWTTRHLRQRLLYDQVSVRCPCRRSRKRGTKRSTSKAPWQPPQHQRCVILRERPLQRPVIIRSNRLIVVRLPLSRQVPPLKCRP